MSFNPKQFQQKATKTIEHIKKDVATLRTGRASAQLLDPVVVEAYGSRLKLVEVASVQAPDPTLLVVTPWDKNLIEDVERAIATADLNLQPVVDGDIIRIKISPLTGEKREQMIKLLYQKIEAGLVLLRQLRTDFKQEIEAQQGDGGVSEDDIQRDLDNLEQEFKKVSQQVEDIKQSKEQELKQVG